MPREDIKLNKKYFKLNNLNLDAAQRKHFMPKSLHKSCSQSFAVNRKSDHLGTNRAKNTTTNIIIGFAHKNEFDGIHELERVIYSTTVLGR